MPHHLQLHPCLREIVDFNDWIKVPRERRRRTFRVCEVVVVSHVLVLKKNNLNTKSVQHFARLVTKLYMELVREFDISQHKMVYQVRGRPCNPQ
jgi:hypothetical protein